MVKSATCYTVDLKAGLHLTGFGVEVGLCHEGWWPYPRVAGGLNFGVLGIAASAGTTEIYDPNLGDATFTVNDYTYEDQDYAVVVIANHHHYTSFNLSRDGDLYTSRYELGLMSMTKTPYFSDGSYDDASGVVVDLGALVFYGLRALAEKIFD